MQGNENRKEASLKISSNDFDASKKIAEALIAMKSGLKLLAENMHPSLRKLANYGWYISGDLLPGDVLVLASELERGNVKAVDNYFQRLYDKEAKNLIANLKRDYPERSKLLAEAFKAHKNRMYFASTSLFLSIADGFCQGILFKSKNGKKPKLDDQFSNRSPLEEIIAVITEVNAIDEAHRKKNNYQSGLNRHGVMHGLDLDYGTKLNSLKALSLLIFITDFFVKPKRE